ncbi:MAG TPA: DUF4230 domain-containing protein [Verrucomicrobiae bacterium]
MQEAPREIPQKPRDSVWVMWRWPLVLLIIFTATLITVNRAFNRATKSLMPSYTTTTVIQTSVQKLRQEAKLVVLSADVTVEVTRTSSKILFDRLDFGDTVTTVRTKGNRAQYFVDLNNVKESDFRLRNGGQDLVVTVPEPRVDESIVEVQSDPSQIEVQTKVGWLRTDKKSGELTRAEAKKALRDAVISEAKSQIYVDLARKNAQEKVTALLDPLVKQMGVTNLTVQFRRP